jgi:hypothetical protein
MKKCQLLVRLCVFSVATTFFFIFKVNIRHDKLNLLTSSTICGRFPREEDITIDNTIWQVLEIPRGDVKLMNAYLDDRQNQTFVRINVNSVSLNLSRDDIYCQFWFDDKTQPTVVKASDYTLMWFNKGLNYYNLN